MIIDITDEERIFLHRMLARAVVFCEMGIKVPDDPSNFLNDSKKLKDLRAKLIEDT
jgi:hypothetical protein